MSNTKGNKDCSKELIAELGSNIKSVNYNTDTELWTIFYKDNLPPDELNVDNFLLFLRNG